MQQKEALSAYMDGHDVSGEFTDTLCNDADLQQKWAHYHAIRSIMRNEKVILGSDFSNKLATLLEDEHIEPAPMKKERGLTLKRWSMPIIQTGIAASVCLVAVLSVNYFNNNNEVAQAEQPVLQTMPFSNSIEAVSYNSPAKDQPTESQLEQQQRRINALLQNHELQRRSANNQVGLNEAEKQASQLSATEK